MAPNNGGARNGRRPKISKLEPQKNKSRALTMVKRLMLEATARYQITNPQLQILGQCGSKWIKLRLLFHKTVH